MVGHACPFLISSRGANHDAHALLGDEPGVAISGAFIAINRFAFAPTHAIWVAFGVAIGAAVLALAATAVALLRGTQVLSGLSALIAIALIMLMAVLHGSDARWWAFGLGAGLAGASLVSATIHELSSERVRHELEVAHAPTTLSTRRRQRTDRARPSGRLSRGRPLCGRDDHTTRNQRSGSCSPITLPSAAASREPEARSDCPTTRGGRGRRDGPRRGASAVRAWHTNTALVRSRASVPYVSHATRTGASSSPRSRASGSSSSNRTTRCVSTRPMPPAVMPARGCRWPRARGRGPR